MGCHPPLAGGDASAVQAARSPDVAAVVSPSQAEAGPYIWWLCHPAPVGVLCVQAPALISLPNPANKKEGSMPLPFKVTHLETHSLPLRSLGLGHVAI